MSDPVWKGLNLFPLARVPNDRHSCSLCPSCKTQPVHSSCFPHSWPPAHTKVRNYKCLVQLKQGSQWHGIDDISGPRRFQTTFQDDWSTRRSYRCHWSHLEQCISHSAYMTTLSRKYIFVCTVLLSGISWVIVGGKRCNTRANWEMHCSKRDQ